MDASIVLARNIVQVNYDDIPGEAIEAAKRDILDTLGVAVAGSNAPGGREIMGLVREWGGKEESTVIMHSQRVPSPYAALVNGTMAHALDFEDSHEGVVLHAGVSVIPAAFAVAERVGKVSGKELLTAVTSGVDVVCRLGEASNQSPSIIGWHYTSLYGIFGAAAAAGKLLELDEQQMVNAFGIAYSQAAGNFQCVIDGALSKRLQAGFAASGGLTSSLMASRGLTGARNTLEGEKGLYQVYHHGDYNPKRLTAGLGKHFAIVDLSFKPYPCCRNCHPFIDATLALAAEHNLAADNVEEISIRCGEVARLLCEPLDIKQKPRVLVDAQFSIPWAVATALVKRKVALEDFTPEAITNPVVLRVASKVKAEVEPQMETRGTSPALVEIKMKDSSVIYSKREDIAKGNPKKPMSWGELCHKFSDCARHGAKPVSQDSVEKAISLLADLEKVEDVGEIIRLLG
jgi:2-methylcitrate dehydratase PrpD